MPSRRLRMLVAKAGLDGHDRGARVIAAALRDAGVEVIYSGLRAPIAAIAQTAVQEAVDLIGLSVLSGAHTRLCQQLCAALAIHDARIPIVLGGIIPTEDRAALLELGVRAIFGPETPLPELVQSLERIATQNQGASPTP